jgi:hypothetical protein
LRLPLTGVTVISNPVWKVRVTGVRIITLFIGVWLVGSGPLAAATLQDTLDAFGFSGTWAIDCTADASPDNNVRVVSVSPAGDPMFTESLGSTPNIYVIMRARSDGDTITLRTKLNGEIEQDITMKRDADRIRTISNRVVSTGRLVVVDGTVTSNKRKTPWLTHCQP